LTPAILGCAPEVAKCTKYHFIWDFEHFIAKREWYKKYDKCLACGKKN
jgi:hypothetical protein